MIAAAASNVVMDCKSPHAMTSDAVAATMHVRVDAGLTHVQALERLARYGHNILPAGAVRSPWLVFLAQFKSILILILLGAALLAALIGSTKDAAVILAVVVINAFVGFCQEYRAERSLDALKAMLPLKARVRRDGKVREIGADAVVPGDLLLLEAGDSVAADGRLSFCSGVDIDESALTGESQPASKQCARIVAADAPLGDRFNMAYMNTLLTRGRAELIVTATGTRTETGQLSRALALAGDMATPLQIQLDHLARRLGAIALTMVAMLSFLQYLQGAELTHILLAAIALAVAAIPEGLPVVVTVTLALGMHKMAQRHAIVKRLSSVETLGCTSVICSDKTGTLTLNQMTARTFYYEGTRFEVSGMGYQAIGTITPTQADGVDSDVTALLVPLAACNDSRIDEGKIIGDPMEAALLVLAAKGNVVREQVERDFPRLAEVPFDPATKFMATLHRQADPACANHITLFVKGAPDVLLARCATWRVAGTEKILDMSGRSLIEAEYDTLGKQGLRGLLVASRLLPPEQFDAASDLSGWIGELCFIGLIGLMDPPRPEAKQAIADCRQAGIVVKMITGDHQTTACAIASELGLYGRAMSGAEIDRLDHVQLEAAIDDVAVFSRVTPAHKVTILRALQARGHVVAMTGDGVNDAPALKQADIGVAMGIAGTAVAKEAATMVLIDDNFASIVSAVRHGRTLYDNILKFVRFQLSTTIGAILTVFFAPLVGLPEPFTAVQILWVAIIMDGPPAVSLALDAARPGIMSEPPRRRSAPILPVARVARIVVLGLTMTVGTLSILYYGLQTGPQNRALTMAFTTFVLFQIFNVFNARNETGSAFNANFFDNPMLWMSLGVTLLLQAAVVHWEPASLLFGTTGMRWSDWGVAVAVASSILLLDEGRKLAWRIARRLRD